jgi:transposase
MIDYACFCQMKHLHTHEGLNASQIAKTLTLDPRTVSHWLAQEHFRPRKPRQSPSKLDPFKPELVRLLERYPYSAAQIFQRLRERALTAATRLSKLCGHTVRPPEASRLSHAGLCSGECAQVDWGSFGSVPVGQTPRQLSCFVMVLCYSRMLYVEFTVSPDHGALFGLPSTRL